MINFKIKNNKSGFTLVETMFAVFILTFAIASLMNVVANSLFSARYARDEITANYLAQEVVDYIRNDRDTTVFLQDDTITDNAWTEFVGHYNQCGSNSSPGCYIDVLSGDLPSECIDEDCTMYLHPDAEDGSFYNYENNGIKANFTRRIEVDVNDANPDQLDVLVTVSWKNGSVDRSRSLETSLLKWQQ